MENKVLEIFEECVTNGEMKCATCPYHGKEPRCIVALGKDLMTYIETLKDQIEYYEEVIEEYEKAEHSEEEMYKPFTITDISEGTFYGKGGEWTMTFDATSDGEYSIATASSGCCDESWTTTTSGVSAHAEGIATTTSGSYAHAEGTTTTASGAYTPVKVGFTRSLGYDLGRLDAISSSSKWELESAVEKAAETMEEELKKKAKKPRWLDKWTEKT